MKPIRIALTLASLALAGLLFSGTGQAQEKPTLTVYTYDSFAADWGPGPKVKEAFEAQCDCILEFVASDSSIGALRKVQLEGEETEADIVLGLDTNIAEAARDTGLFAEHNTDLSALSLPVEWEDPLFVPFDYSYFAFVYDSTRLENPPTSFAELADQPDDFKIIIQDPRSSTPGLGLVLWVREVFGEAAPEYWQSIKPNILTVTKGWSEAYNLFLKGESDMVLSYTTSPAYHRIAEGEDQYEAAIFEDGHYLQIEIAGLLKSSDQPELGRQFLQFMLSDTFQDIIPTTNWTYPATTTQAGLPEGFDALTIPERAILLDDSTVEQNRKAYIDEWLSAIE